MLQACDLAPQQKAIMQARTPIIFVYGGVGTYKTTGGIIRTWFHINAYPGQKFMVFAQTYKQLRRVYIPEWKKQIPSHLYKYNKNDDEIYVPQCNSTLYLHYADRDQAIEVLKGMSISGYHMIQAEDIKDEEFYHTAEDRLRLFGKEHIPTGKFTEKGQEIIDQRQEYLRIIDANPGNPGHWVHELFIDESQRRFITSMIDTNEKHYLSPKRVTRIRVRTNANTSTYSEETIALWRNTRPGWYIQRYIEGEWVPMEGRVWDDYEIFKHPAADMPGYAAQFDRIFLGCDPGQTHPTAVVFIGVKSGIYEIFDEIVASDRSVRSIWLEMKTKIEQWGFNIQKFIKNIWVDPSAKQWVTEFNDLKYQKETNDCKMLAMQSRHKGTDPVLNRVIKLYEMFKTKRLRISDYCKTVIQDCERTIWKEGSKDQIDKNTYDPHAMDAVGYAITKET